MKRSTDRILTTHTGSLPRPAGLLKLVREREAGGSVDSATYDAEVAEAVGATVRRQVEAGVDVVGDGEVSKPSYATYPKDRLSGFGGKGSIEEVSGQMLSFDEFPDFAEQMAALLGQVATIKFVSCDGPVTFHGGQAVRQDIENLQAALQDVEATEAFMSSASPGVISVFAPNHHYPSEEAYLEALAQAMRAEYEAIAAAGFVLQLDCPDLAMTAPGEASLAEHRRKMEMRVEALNEAVAGIPAEAMRLHVCWGNGEFPRHQDVELRDIVDIIYRAKPAGIMLMASNGRHAHEWQVFKEAPLPEGKYLVPGVVDSTSNVIEHPEVVAERLANYAGVVGKENVMAGSDCGFGTIAGMTTVVASVAWAKLAAMAEGARLASERLW